MTQLTPSIFVPSSFLLVPVSQAVATLDTCVPRPLTPENTAHSSALLCCVRDLVVLPDVHLRSCLLLLSRKRLLAPGFVHTPNSQPPLQVLACRILLAPTNPPILRLQLTGVK
jgi:hypothetical protein